MVDGVNDVISIFSGALTSRLCGVEAAIPWRLISEETFTLASDTRTEVSAAEHGVVSPDWRSRSSGSTSNSTSVGVSTTGVVGVCNPGYAELAADDGLEYWTPLPCSVYVDRLLNPVDKRGALLCGRGKPSLGGGGILGVPHFRVAAGSYTASVRTCSESSCLVVCTTSCGGIRRSVR